MSAPTAVTVLRPLVPKMPFGSGGVPVPTRPTRSSSRAIAFAMTLDNCRPKSGLSCATSTEQLHTTASVRAVSVRAAKVKDWLAVSPSVYFLGKGVLASSQKGADFRVGWRQAHACTSPFPFCYSLAGYSYDGCELVAAHVHCLSKAGQLAAVLFGLIRTAVLLRAGLARPWPQTTFRKCVGSSLNEACMARPSTVLPNTDFQK